MSEALTRLLEDPAITEVLIDGPGRAYVVRGGRLEDAPEDLGDAETLAAAIRAIIAPYGAALDAASPIVNLRLADGTHLSAVAAPISAEGPSLTLRKYASHTTTAEDLVRYGSWTPGAVAFLRGCVAAGVNLLVAGGSASGKTTVLNILAGMIPEEERVISVEETRELQVRRRRLLALEARRPDASGRGGVSAAELVEQALRMMPERIIVGELRGAELLPLLGAMATGHSGSMALMHATSPRDALARLEIMATSAEPTVPLLTLRAQLAAGFELIVQVNRLADGTRRVTHLTEVAGMERDALALRDLALFDERRGALAPTGERPAFLERFGRRGVPVPEDLLGEPQP